MVSHPSIPHRYDIDRYGREIVTLFFTLAPGRYAGKGQDDTLRLSYVFPELGDNAELTRWGAVANERIETIRTWVTGEKKPPFPQDPFSNLPDLFTAIERIEKEGWGGEGQLERRDRVDEHGLYHAAFRHLSFHVKIGKEIVESVATGWRHYNDGPAELNSAHHLIADANGEIFYGEKLDANEYGTCSLTEAELQAYVLQSMSAEARKLTLHVSSGNAPVADSSEHAAHMTGPALQLVA